MAPQPPPLAPPPGKPLSSYAQGAGLFRRRLFGNIKWNLIRENFEISTWLSMGATIQLLLLLIFPTHYAILPALSILVSKLTYTFLILYKVIPNPRFAQVSPGTHIRSFPAGYVDGTGNSVQASKLPGNGSLSVVMISAQSHHPFGHFAPRYDFADITDSMIRDLEIGSATNGFLGATSYLNSTQFTSGNGIMTLLYFRSQEDVHKFHKSRSHLQGTKWVAGNRRVGFQWYGIYQENFVVRAGSWDNFSAKMVPSMMDATVFPIPDKSAEGGIRWEGMHKQEIVGNEFNKRRKVYGEQKVDSQDDLEVTKVKVGD